MKGPQVEVEARRGGVATAPALVVLPEMGHGQHVALLEEIPASTATLEDFVEDFASLQVQTTLALSNNQAFGIDATFDRAVDRLRGVEQASLHATVHDVLRRHSADGDVRNALGLYTHQEGEAAGFQATENSLLETLGPVKREQAAAIAGELALLNRQESVLLFRANDLEAAKDALKVQLEFTESVDVVRLNKSLQARFVGYSIQTPDGSSADGAMLVLSRDELAKGAEDLRAAMAEVGARPRVALEPGTMAFIDQKGGGL